jgi:hypothetical protein
VETVESKKASLVERTEEIGWRTAGANAGDLRDAAAACGTPPSVAWIAWAGAA